ncbi:MAG: YqgE/AlgH family protein [Rhodobacteraceae bacterium]|nr:YqgE/AlgH family protein [Paracoccaceae bacterium]
MDTGATDLTGKMLIAMPGMGDARFEQSLVYLCAHTDTGAMGLIVNKPAADVTLNDLWSQLEIEGDDGQDARPVYYGGPVEQSRGFVLHGADYEGGGESLQVTQDFRMTATIDILRDIRSGVGPARFLLALGYAGWGPGQLEAEFAQNGWLVCAGSHELVFKTPDSEKWGAALKSLGVSPMALSSEGGRA